MASNLIGMSGRGLPDRVDFGESKGDSRTPYIEVMIQTIRPDGANGEIISWKGWLTPKAIGRTIEQLQLLGARCNGSEFDDLQGLGSKVANVSISDDPQYGKRVEFINPPGRSSVRDDTRLDKSKLAALKAALKPAALGAVMANGGTKPPQPSTTPPWQRGPAPSAPSTANLDAADVEPWNEPDAYQGLEEPSQAPQQSAPVEPPQQRRAAPF